MHLGSSSWSCFLHLPKSALARSQTVTAGGMPTGRPDPQDGPIFNALSLPCSSFPANGESACRHAAGTIERLYRSAAKVPEMAQKIKSQRGESAFDVPPCPLGTIPRPTATPYGVFWRMSLVWHRLPWEFERDKGEIPYMRAGGSSGATTRPQAWGRRSTGVVHGPQNRREGPGNALYGRFLRCRGCTCDVCIDFVAGPCTAGITYGMLWPCVISLRDACYL